MQNLTIFDANLVSGGKKCTCSKNGEELKSFEVNDLDECVTGCCAYHRSHQLQMLEGRVFNCSDLPPGVVSYAVFKWYDFASWGESPSKNKDDFFSNHGKGDFFGFDQDL